MTAYQEFPVLWRKCRKRHPSATESAMREGGLQSEAWGSGSHPPSFLSHGRFFRSRSPRYSPKRHRSAFTDWIIRKLGFAEGADVIAALAGIAIPLLVSAALLTTVYFVGFRKGKGGIEPQPVKIVASHSWDQHELHERARTWLGSQMAEGKLRVDTAFLFGSILHEHYATSDVDVIVRFREMSERKIASAARKIKGSIAQDFERTFGHRLHAQFFCAHEDERFKAFIGRAGKTEQFYPRA